jgi:hypothetical protein
VNNRFRSGKSASSLTSPSVRNRPRPATCRSTPAAAHRSGRSAAPERLPTGMVTAFDIAARAMAFADRRAVRARFELLAHASSQRANGTTTLSVGGCKIFSTSSATRPMASSGTTVSLILRSLPRSEWRGGWTWAGARLARNAPRRPRSARLRRAQIAPRREAFQGLAACPLVRVAAPPPIAWARSRRVAWRPQTAGISSAYPATRVRGAKPVAV